MYTFQPLNPRQCPPLDSNHEHEHVSDLGRFTNDLGLRNPKFNVIFCVFMTRNNNNRPLNIILSRDHCPATPCAYDHNDYIQKIFSSVRSRTYFK